MTNTKKIFYAAALMGVIVVTSAAIWPLLRPNRDTVYTFPTTKYGAFLAAQHAIYVNDFDAAARMVADLTDQDFAVVRNTVILADFLGGNLPDDAVLPKGDLGAMAGLVRDAINIRDNNWDAVYARHKDDKTVISAPMRIWASVATGRVTGAMKFIDGLSATDSWKDFMRGYIYAQLGKTETAARHFANVKTDFMNINDYLCIMSFYDAHNMTDAAAALRGDFTRRPGGMFMSDNDFIPDWSDYSGFNRALSFSLIQSVSHGRVMMYSDLSLLLLRLAGAVNGGATSQSTAINYYVGQYFLNNGGDYGAFFDDIDAASPFYPFACMKLAEKSGTIADLERTVRANPLFVPGITKLVAKNVQSGNRRAALRVVNRALDNDNLADAGRAFMLKTRAQIYLTFSDYDNAQSDIRAAADITPNDVEVLALQSRIWSATGRELENAYDYAIALVHKSPGDVFAWDTLGMAVRAREGASAAIDILDRVGDVANACSALFDHLGDLYIETGDTRRAADAFDRAIALSDDGLVVVRDIEKKIRRLK